MSRAEDGNTACAQALAQVASEKRTACQHECLHVDSSTANQRLKFSRGPKASACHRLAVKRRFHPTSSNILQFHLRQEPLWFFLEQLARRREILRPANVHPRTVEWIRPRF